MPTGERVILRAPEAQDTEIFAAWQNDRDIAALLPYSAALSYNAIENLISGLKYDNSKFMFIIENEDQIPIGICLLKDIDWINSTAFIGIVIYARNCWGKGYGCDAVKALTSFGLDEINMYNIYTGVPEDNEMAVKCFQNAGYEIEGTLKDRISIKGIRKNLIAMSISKDLTGEI